MRNLDSIDFVQKAFRDYYIQDFFLNESPSMIEKREFGFASFEGWMLRHKTFKDKEELLSFLQNSTPRDAYFSCAYYEDPEAEMEKKGWIGADLIFDIDADHIPTPCGKIHDEWTCGNCGFAGKGVTPEKCPICESEKFDTHTWPCETCLNSAKDETIKLLDMLMQDFGFSEKEIHIFFSGHRGYHVHVENEAIKTLDAISRKEIVDYVCGLGLEVLGSPDQKNRRRTTTNQNPTFYNSGWHKRLMLGMQDFILNANEEDFRRIGIRKTVFQAIMQNKDTIIKNLTTQKTLSAVKGVGLETWRKIAEQCVTLQSAKIDTVVTTDIHRLIRLANTLHGKTGFKKIEFSLSEIDKFDPFTSAIVFKKETIKTFVFDAPNFRLGNEMFGPYKNQKVELPLHAAIFLICKNKAEVQE